MMREWRLVAPDDVAYTPREIEVIGMAVQQLQRMLPGRYVQVKLDGLEVIAPDDPGRTDGST